ncbi:MAG TPA: hypothetical protein VGM81_15760 [Burkholderiaceae bacterium]|jgi:hypothetical protein
MLATAPSNAVAEHRFAPHHRWDPRGLQILLALIWLGVLMGFGGSIAKHFAKHDLDYPLIVHVHAAAFVGWMALFTTQMVLIRSHQHALHKKLGLFGVGLAAFMVVIGPITAIVTARLHFGMPDSDPAFLAVSFSSILNFAVLVTAALLLRRQGPSHKRLMMLGLLALAPAGFARWLGGPIIGMVGPGPLGMWCLLYLITTALVLSIGVHDLVTRRRLLPAYVLGAAFSLGVQVASAWLLFSPAWLALMKQLVAH